MLSQEQAAVARVVSASAQTTWTRYRSRARHIIAILALLQRFYDPTGGRLEFGDVDSQAIPLATLRSHMAIVSQNSVLFEGDIRFNLSVSQNVVKAASYRPSGLSKNL